MRGSGLRRGLRPAGPAIATLVLLAALALGAAGQAIATPPAYTALGDSYASGVGTREYIADGTSCRRSLHAYPELLAGRTGASLTFAACSGATTIDVLNGQLGSLNAGTTYVTVQAGGNDMHFSKIIEKCAEPWPTTCWGDIDNANAFIRDTLPGRLDTLYSRIHSLAQNATVVVVGYPRLFNGQECNLFARISPGEQAALDDSADRLAVATGARAAAHGFRFADARPAFTGHEVCDAVEWLNGLSNPVSESYHPNQAGHVGYANLVQPDL
jgi:lysophospholipase L1-like esterase